MIGIFTVDPGTTSGVARGLFERCDSAWEGVASGRWESWEVEGTPAEQAWEIMGEYADWLERLRSQEKASGDQMTIAFAIEDFTVRLGRGAASRRELLDPVRVAAGCEALSWTRGGLRWVQIQYQQPSERSIYTNDRLREHGMWVKGSEHRRDAVRHLILRYSKIITS